MIPAVIVVTDYRGKPRTNCIPTPAGAVDMDITFRHRKCLFLSVVNIIRIYDRRNVPRVAMSMRHRQVKKQMKQIGTVGTPGPMAKVHPRREYSHPVVL